MKLQILTQEQEPVGGFKTLIIERNNLDLSEISDNECEVILASDAMDSVSYSSAEQLVAAFITKLRLNGELIVGGTDVRLFSKAVFNGQISPEEASNTVTNVHSMTNGEQMKEIFTKMGLEVQSSYLDGLHYEIKAKRVE